MIAIAISIIRCVLRHGFAKMEKDEKVIDVRLVDADKQLKWIDCIKPVYGIGLEPVIAVETLRDIIQGMPEIEAIPVEWIRSQIGRMKVKGSPWVALALESLVKAWEQENGHE